MRIVFNLSAYYEWEQHPESDDISRVLAHAAEHGEHSLHNADKALHDRTQAEILGIELKPSHDGNWLRSFVKPADTFLEVSLDEGEIADAAAHFKRTKQFWPRTREQVAAWYLATKTLPHHAAPEHFIAIFVHDEPRVEAYLNEFFEVGQATSPEEDDDAADG